MDAAHALDEIRTDLYEAGQSAMVERLLAEFDAELIAVRETNEWLVSIDVQHDLFNQSETWEV